MAPYDGDRGAIPGRNKLMRRWRVLGFLRKERLDQELDDELRFHFETLVSEYERRGMPAGEARAAARQTLGGFDEIKEAYRDQRTLPMIETLAADVRFGLRSLARRPGFAAVALLSLALGIGANSAMFSVLYAALLRPLPYAAQERLVFVTTYFPTMKDSVVLAPDYLEWLDRNRSFEKLSAYTIGDHTYQGREFPERVAIADVTHEFFPAFGAAPMFAGDDTIVLSHSFWTRRCGADPGILGRALRLDGKAYTVTGVMPQSFQFPPNAEAWIPFPMDAARYAAGGPVDLVRVIGRLRSGVTLEQARGEIEHLSKLPSGRPRPPGAQVRLLGLRDYISGKTRPALLLLTGAVAFVLLITCANMANLLAARGVERQRELAIRAAIGAAQRRLARQLITESLLLAILGGALGAVLAVWAMRALAPLVPASVERPETLLVFAVSLVTALLAGLTFGSAPAILAARTDVNQVLKRSGRGAAHGEGARWRAALTISQVALSLALLLGAGLTMRSLHRTLSVHPGFDPDQTVSFLVRPRGNQDTAAFFTRLLEELRRIPGVDDVGLASRFPFSAAGPGKALISVDGESPWPREEGAKHMVEAAAVSSGYFRTLRIPLLAGRIPRDEEKDVVVVNESFRQRFFPAEDAIGKRFKTGIAEANLPLLTIAGVVGDVRGDSLEEPINPAFYRTYLREGLRARGRIAGVAIRSRTSLAQLAQPIRRAVAAVDPDVPVDDLRAMEDRLADSVAPQRLRTTLLALFGALALALAFAGVYGVMAYAASRRESEFGLRLALGATPERLCWGVVGDGMRLAACGAVLGLAMAALVSRFLRTLLFQTGSFDAGVYGAVVALLGLTALAASYLPALKASRTDPLEALRRE
jgi:putative ABC transport system permease protein